MNIFILVAVLVAPPIVKLDVVQRTFHGFEECDTWAKRWYTNAPPGFKAICLPSGRRVT